MDKSRQQFEEEYRKHSTLDEIDIFKIDSESDDYYYLATRWAWRWWQASRESLINSLEPVGYAAEIDINEIEIYGQLFLNEDPTEETNIPLYRLDK
ncbi:hypothetical protein EX227_23250 [Providencia rettgeri]|uniref:Uncharacterized protein n=1 Tax=Providencia rettgeri TaxID=587 RepID=A0AAP2K2X0_PRORE|nr:hypothetical protein [Providencia rettgeri]MBX6952904.1 hypothetical protein [Providencia rettgeri]MBX6957682.1 hypothetical protein [Providencia rettgeri]MBX6962540.1 hypothetical protein [Providencia rettgeri]MBX6972828.1 hypothetical protein [Providencia rettgeri]MBX6983181.1 hypothetical protein [Providencia rettgeri]